MGKPLNIPIGKVFGKLTIIKEVEKFIQPSGQSQRAFLCQCECGNTSTVRCSHLTNGRIASCGCLGGEKHGDAGSLLYNVWRGMKNRCYCDSYQESHLYKDKGIEICQEWKNSYIAFKEWAISAGWAHGLQVDRINGDKGYSPENCRCVTPVVNANNTKLNTIITYKGAKQSLRLLLHSKSLSSNFPAIYGRIKRGWDHTEAVDTPIRTGNYKKNIGQ